MLEDYMSVRRIVLARGTVDLRKGIDGLAMIIGDRYRQNPFEKGTLFLFCGRRSDRIKGLLRMGTGFCLLYMRLEDGSFSWPRTTAQAADLTEEHFLPVFPAKARRHHGPMGAAALRTDRQKGATYTTPSLENLIFFHPFPNVLRCLRHRHYAGCGKRRIRFSIVSVV